MRRKRRDNEKAKNLIGTWKKLLGYCRRYLAVFLIAILCAAAGTILTLAGPDQLSKLTDTITEGIAPGTSIDMDKIRDIGLFLVGLYVRSEERRVGKECRL